eukprot:5921884-Amphidinium_carterae.1
MRSPGKSYLFKLSRCAFCCASSSKPGKVPPKLPADIALPSRNHDESRKVSNARAGYAQGPDCTAAARAPASHLKGAVANNLAQIRISATLHTSASLWRVQLALTANFGTATVVTHQQDWCRHWLFWHSSGCNPHQKEGSLLSAQAPA